MRKNRQISHAEELQIIYVYKGGGALTPCYLIKCRLYKVPSFQKVQYVFHKSNFTVEKPDKHYLGQVVKAIIISKSC